MTSKKEDKKKSFRFQFENAYTDEEFDENNNEYKRPGKINNLN